MVLAIGNYLLAQLTSMGLLLQGITEFDDRTAFIAGVIILAVIMLVYENLGGFRAVAWTDMIQGGILMIGFIVLLFVVLDHFGGLSSSYELLKSSKPEKVSVPNAHMNRQWFSYIFVVGLGGALYPQAIQRIYAARSQKVLRNGVATMAFLPLTASLVAVLVGITALASPELSELSSADSDRVFSEVCRIIMGKSVLHRWLVVLLLAAVLAALMSTADSVLLSVSSMLTKDIYFRQINKNASQAKLTLIGKIISFIVVFIIASVAIYLQSLENKPTLVKLMNMKFDILMQLAPGFILGMHWRGMKANAPFWGLVCGLICIFTLYRVDTLTNWGIHAGIFGLIVNLLIVFIITKFSRGNISDKIL